MLIEKIPKDKESKHNVTLMTLRSGGPLQPTPH